LPMVVVDVLGEGGKEAIFVIPGGLAYRLDLLVGNDGEERWGCEFGFVLDDGLVE